MDKSSFRANASQADDEDQLHASGESVPRIESATLWRNEKIEGVELFHGDFQTYSFTRHFHSVASFGAVQSGVMRS